jgi:uncharacterized Fe-S center protein
MPEEKKELTKGEKIVRVEFNPDNVGNVNFFKSKIAELINAVDEIKDYDPRLAAIATTTLEEASMWAVKLATAKS